MYDRIIEFHLNSANGPIIGQCATAFTGDWGVFTTTTCPVANAKTGVGTLVLRSLSNQAGWEFMNFEWFRLIP